MTGNVEKFTCTKCGSLVKTLFKRYSPTVLKLTDCEVCGKVADNYVEYDIIIVIIDLVLLQKSAYRHVLFNLKLKNFWKLTVILLLMESYSEWVHLYPDNYKANKDDIHEKPYLHDVNAEMNDFQFYRICANTFLRISCFITVLYTLTVVYCKYFHKNVSFSMVLKTFTISSFGIFLLLPSLIWDNSVQEVHLIVVTLYTTMSQLLAYTALIDCHKIWSITAVFCSYYCKSFLLDVLNVLDQ